VRVPAGARSQDDGVRRLRLRLLGTEPGPEARVRQVLGARRGGELLQQPAGAGWDRLSQGDPGPDRRKRPRQLRDGVHSVQSERRVDAQPRPRARRARHPGLEADLLLGRRGELVQRGADRDRPAPQHPGVVRLGYLALWERPQRDHAGPFHHVPHRPVLSPEQGLQAADRPDERPADSVVQLHRRRLREHPGLRPPAGLYDRPHEHPPLQALYPGFPDGHPQRRGRLRCDGSLPHDARPQHADPGSGPAADHRRCVARREREQRQPDGQQHRHGPECEPVLLHEHERRAVHRAGHQLGAAPGRAAELRAAERVPGRAHRQRVRQGHRPVPDHQLHGARSDRERQHRRGGRIGRRGDRLRQLPHAARLQFRHPDGVLTMNTRRAALLAGVVILSGGCNNWLDVNTNPNGPQSVSAILYLPPMLHWMVTSPQFDGRFVGRYAQEWMLVGTIRSTWDRMGYDPASDNGAQQWRDVYWSLGQNLIDMNAKATAEQRWDLLGVGLILKAWGWQVLTDLHGEIIIKEAFDPTRTSFDYDTQDYAYQEVARLLDSAIVLLRRTDGAVDKTYLAQGDHIYGGDRVKWLRL